MPLYNCIYSLNRKSPIEAWGKESGMTTRLARNDSTLRVEGVESNSPEDAFASAREAAERFLDGVSRTCDSVDLTIASDEMNAETLDDQGNVRGYALTAVVQMRMTLNAHVVQRDADGNVIYEHDSARPGEISLASSDAPRYFRKARTSADVFEKFRNYYYVLEYVGSRILAHTKLKPKGYEGEQGLIQYGVEQAFPGESDRLRGVAKMVPGIDSALQVYVAVSEFLYRRHRLELQHAKFRMPRKVPFRRLHEQDVREALPLVEAVAQRLLSLERQLFGP